MNPTDSLDSPPPERLRPAGARASAHPTPRPRRGVLDPRRVQLASFVISAIGLLFSTVVTVLAIWNRAPRDTAWRSLATLGVLVGAAMLFNVVNYFFGARLDEVRATPAA